MTGYLLGASVIFLALLNPAIAVGPTCEDQLAAIDSQLSSYPHAPTALDDKYKQAVQLCRDKQDVAAQELARQIREEMAAVSSPSNASGASSGSSNPSLGGK
jgi:hypothetical protein